MDYNKSSSDVTLDLEFNSSSKFNPVMYVFVNSDLKLRKGRVAAQVGHIVQIITEEIVRNSYEQYPPPIHCFTYMKCILIKIQYILSILYACMYFLPLFFI